ncbi:MAG: hypothetical protein HC842_06825 [Cytophagales bacterium]|nr:hypothetical protein [Cytophagales bacterium]
MISQFEGLSVAEQKLLYQVPALVTVLIAGADGQIDNTELQEAIQVTKRKQITARKDLVDYYEEVAKTFENDIQELISSLPQEPEARTQALVSHLEELNSVLPKLDKAFAIKFYASMKDLAKKVAESSGGFLGYLAVGFEEAQLMGLDMVTNPETY